MQGSTLPSEQHNSHLGSQWMAHRKFMPRNCCEYHNLKRVSTIMVLSHFMWFCSLHPIIHDIPSLKSCNAGIRSMRESCNEWILQPISRSLHNDQVSVFIDVLHRWSTPIRYQRSFPSNITRKSWRRQSVIYDQHVLRLESAKWRSFRLQSNPLSKHAWDRMNSNACSLISPGNVSLWSDRPCMRKSQLAAGRTKKFNDELVTTEWQLNERAAPEQCPGQHRIMMKDIQKANWMSQLVLDVIS